MQPEEGVRQEEVPDFVAAVVENQGAPFPMLTLSRILVLEERRAVKLREAVRVFRKMTGDPVQNHADAAGVTGIDKDLELLRLAEAARRGKKPDDLIAPRPGKRMLHHREQFDMGEPHVLH